MTTERLVISICGPSGSGKSATAVALCERLGADRSVRIPADYFLVPRWDSQRDYFHKPLQYDWPLLREAVDSPIDTVVETPDFDFETFRRIARSSGRTFVSRPIRIIDAMYPCPFADLAVLIWAPADARRERIAARDGRWGTEVLARWEHLEICRTHLENMEVHYDAQLSGLATLATNVTTLAEIVERRIERM